MFALWMPMSCYFYPRPPRGGRPMLMTSRSDSYNYFYPRPPRGGRPRCAAVSGGHEQYFYPRPPRGGRPCQQSGNGDDQCISIHALREEGDDTVCCILLLKEVFLSTPSARRATWEFLQKASNYRFLSTPSARRATHQRKFLYKIL